MREIPYNRYPTSIDIGIVTFKPLKISSFNPSI